VSVEIVVFIGSGIGVLVNTGVSVGDTDTWADSEVGLLSVMGCGVGVRGGEKTTDDKPHRRQIVHKDALAKTNFPNSDGFCGLR
jgi:hypothetical protein